jgi:hypothetical protein
MSHGYHGPNENSRHDLATILDKAWLYPQIGQHVGSRAAEGPPIQATWYGEGPVPFGHASYFSYRTDAEEIIWLPELEGPNELARLTPGEQGLLTAARAQTEEHGPPEENPAPNANANAAATTGRAK